MHAPRILAFSDAEETGWQWAPGVEMGTSVDTVQVLGVRTTARAFVVRALFTGKSGVWVQ